MDAFEEIVKQLLEAQGYWVRHAVKVDISKEDKRRLGLPTMPRPEIDLVALNVKKNELLLIEVKSFLDSQGVYWEVVCDEKEEYVNAKRYRLFTNKRFRETVTKRITEQFLELGLIRKNTTINYALAAGNIHSADGEEKIWAHFRSRGWILISPKHIKEQVKELSQKGWENNLVAMTAKLILRD